MGVATLAQVVTSVTNTLFVAVLAAGYYFTWRVSQQTLAEVREQRTAMGVGRWSSYRRTTTTCRSSTSRYATSAGAARDITFEFSAPLENSAGFVISDLPYFKDGLDFLPPQGELSCYWDDLNSLIPFLEARDLRGGINVIVRY